MMRRAHKLLVLPAVFCGRFTRRMPFGVPYGRRIGHNIAYWTLNIYLSSVFRYPESS